MPPSQAGSSGNVAPLTKQCVEIAASSLCLGIFTMLVLVAIHRLSGKRHESPKISYTLNAMILIMYASAIAYWVSVQYSTYTTYASPGWTNCDPQSGWGCTSATLKKEKVQNCVGSATILINVLIGDSVVWWRAWILWNKKRVIFALFALSILGTFVAGTADAATSCNMTSPSSSTPATIPNQVMNPDGKAARGTVFGGDVWGITAATISLGTNFVSTILIAYKAWQHRRHVRSSLTAGSAPTQAQRLLYLLTESGIFYCVLWSFFLCLELITTHESLNTSTNGINIMYAIMEGSIVLLVGMYPTCIIVLCAMGKSQCEISLAPDSAQHEVALPMHGLSGGDACDSDSAVRIASTVYLPSKAKSSAV